MFTLSGIIKQSCLALTTVVNYYCIGFLLLTTTVNHFFGSFYVMCNGITATFAVITANSCVILVYKELELSNNYDINFVLSSMGFLGLCVGKEHKV